MPLAAQPCPVQVATPHPVGHLAALRDEHLLLWAATPAELPDFGPRVGLLRQLSNARAAKRLVDEVAGEIGRLPDDETERLAWRERLRERLHRFGQERLGWPDGYRRLLLLFWNQSTKPLLRSPI